MYKIACGVVLYYPDVEKIIRETIEYSSIFDKVILFDNTEKKSCEIQERLSEFKNVIYITYSKNVGLPRAYNRILDEVMECDFLCALDQDSLYKTEDIYLMIKAISKLPKDAAVVGPHVIYDNEKFYKKDEFVKKRYVITSGCFINLNYMRREAILFDENYFIDKFEVDLDMQFRVKGYSIYQYENACLYQRLGTIGKNGKSNHSKLRHYYLFRNRYYFNNKYFCIPKRYFLNILQTFRHIMSIILFEENKAEKIVQWPIATYDYIAGRMGIYRIN